MKDIIIMLLICVIIIIVSKMYFDTKIYKERSTTDMLIFGDDTIVITGAKGFNYSKLHDYFLHGYNDTITGIFYTRIKLDTIQYNGITLPKNSVTLPESFSDSDSSIVTYPIIIFDTQKKTSIHRRKKVKDSDSTYHYIYY